MLNDSLAFYKDCFDSTKIGTLVCDEHRNIILSNTPSTKLFGYTKNDFSDIKITALFKDHSFFDDFMEKSRSDHYGTAIETLGIKKSGETVALEIYQEKICYEGRDYYKVLISDISLRKEKEDKTHYLNIQFEQEVKNRNRKLEKVIEQLKSSLHKEKELNNLKTKFISLASHEFKTPLSAILSSAELIVKYSDLQQDSKRDEHLAKVKSTVGHLTNMLDDMLMLENIELGKTILHNSLFSYNDLIYNTIQKIESLLKPNQEILFKGKKDELIYQDTKMIQIILNNLLFNAIKFSTSEGKILVSAETDDKFIYFSVKDNGIGIPVEEQDLIFKRFFRAKNALHYPGTGIGLNIVKGYVQSLNGLIKFESIENKGTHFMVQLPKMDCNICKK